MKSVFLFKRVAAACIYNVVMGFSIVSAQCRRLTKFGKKLLKTN
jgi:hypothetical protein